MLKLEDIKKPLPFNISTNVTIGNIKDFAEFTSGKDDYYEVDFDVFLPSINKNLQRPLCWTLEQKRALVLSVFKEAYIPPIYAIQYKNEKKERKLEIIDGKQRLSTMIAFYNNEFSITVDNKNFYYFKNLSPSLQAKFQFKDIAANLAYSYHYDPIKDLDKINWFEMINFAGTPQEIEHLNSLKTK